jgi:DDE superfamily endonuclease
VSFRSRRLGAAAHLAQQEGQYAELPQGRAELLQRHVTDRRTMVDCAQQLKWLVDERYPEADVIRLVGDQLNTHRIASLYEAFPPEEARRIARKLEFHHTPKHGSWLNLAEIELRVLEGQCLDRRIPDIETLKRETNAYEK